MKSLFEQNGGTYMQVDDYLLPNLELSLQDKIIKLGKYGRLRKEYLKNRRNGIYAGLLISGKLFAHLAEIDSQAKEMLGLLVKQLAEKENITEELKSNDQMTWAGAMNNIKSRAEEILLSEIIYN